MTALAQSLLAGAPLTWDVTAMSGTNVRRSEIMQLGSDVCSLAIQADWTNTLNVVGAFDIEESNDGVTFVPRGIVSPSVSHNNGPAVITVDTSAAFARLIYTNTSGTGTLGALTVQGKRRTLSSTELAALVATEADVVTAQADIAALQDQPTYASTITPALTTGAQTINKPTGTVNAAASTTSLVVTCSYCTTASIVIAVVRSNDTTCKSVVAVPGNGSFTLRYTAPTAETSIGFVVVNQ